MKSSFKDLFEQTSWEDTSVAISSVTPSMVERALDRKGTGGLEDFRALVSSAAVDYLEPMARLSHELTRQRFGDGVRLFAPMYLSNECQNICDYCGFSLTNAVPRKTLTASEIIAEASVLSQQGFEHVLLVTGESQRKVHLQYFRDALRVLRPHFANLSMEVQPLEQHEYESLTSEGLHSVLVYQETYHSGSYRSHHPKGKKSNMIWRLETPDRLGAAGVKKIGLGCLYGLTEDWRTDAFFAALHLDYLERTYWRSTYSMSFPRMRPHEGETPSDANITDRDVVQLLCAYRIFNHELELTLSTRESPMFRDHAFKLGVTTMSAGSRTEPGGYASKDAHETLEQFSISDDRSPAEVARMLVSAGYEPVWKDWDASYDCHSANNLQAESTLDDQPLALVV
ncbi:MAG: 2-iminoacetate synthase ThiH [Verrucomicrobia bacterium]|nr:2-iminoacetate synthase ThiH [Verrucomicrobiota bacterium]MDA0725147.1 2-iminoacetate synthase ThiH [Verrucomicrobiota bacterium]MDA1048553.1 2-iminoacetate synthase ThiH [Verrucomicrobiota bacterium]